MSTNIGYWEEVLQAPTPAYQELFDAEQKYLLENIQPESHVLDIGCGEGRNMQTILQRTGSVTGIDNDRKAVDGALQNFISTPTVKVIQADATHLPFENEAFDVVTFLMILPNLDTVKQQALTESTRVLKKDGYLILSTFAETAFDERVKIYKKLNIPIMNIEGTKVIFDKSLGAHTSEQFSKEDLETLGQNAGLTMLDCQKVNIIGYICKF